MINQGGVVVGCCLLSLELRAIPQALTPPPTAVLLRPGQAAGAQHRVPVRQHCHTLCGQLYRGECQRGKCQRGMAWRGWGPDRPALGPGLRRQEALAESGAGVSLSDCKSGCQGRESSRDPSARAGPSVPVLQPLGCILGVKARGSLGRGSLGQASGGEGSFALCLAGPLVTLPPPTPQGGCATFLCQPLDVLKTRLMNSRGEYQVSGGWVRDRVGPHTPLLPGPVAG